LLKEKVSDAQDICNHDLKDIRVHAWNANQTQCSYVCKCCGKFFTEDDLKLLHGTAFTSNVSLCKPFWHGNGRTVFLNPADKKLIMTVIAEAVIPENHHKILKGIIDGEKEPRYFECKMTEDEIKKFEDNERAIPTKDLSK